MEVATMTLALRLIAFVPLALTIAGCSSEPQIVNASNDSAAFDENMTAIAEDQDALSMGNAVPLTLTNQWIGRWNGPEGLFMDIQSSAEGQYKLAIKDNLDDQAQYTGTAQGRTIIFTRNGKAEVIRSGSGAQTGFKYLADKQDCLIIQPGKEGYCR